MSPLLLVTNWLFSFAIGWYYLGWYYDYAQGTVYVYYFLAAAIVCGSLMFLWIPEIGEENRLMFFGFDTGIDLKPGTYVLANAAPFLREIKINVGFSIARLENGKKIKNENVNVNIYRDQQKTEYSARVTTTSFLALNTDKAFSLFLSFLFTFEDKHGQIQYYKVGRTYFLILLLVTAFARIVYPSNVHITQPSITQSPSPSFTPPSHNEITQEVNHQVKTDVLLKKGTKPVMPDGEKFRMQMTNVNTVYFFFIDNRKYIAYTEPPIGKIRGMQITESACLLIPWGKEMVFFTKYPPQYAVNVIDSISYLKKESSYNIFERLVVTSRKWRTGEDTVIEKEVSWNTLYNNWNEVEGESKGVQIKARYQRNDDDKRIGGGIVCF